MSAAFISISFLKISVLLIEHCLLALHLELREMCRETGELVILLP